MRKDNAGFTLVELLVSISILGILIAAAFGFMVSGSNIFKNVETRKNLRMEVQLAANLIESYIIDCSDNIYFDGSSLFIINSEGSEYSAHIFEISGSNLNYGFAAEVSEIKEPYNGYSCSYAAEDFICVNVESFSVTIYPLESEEASFAELEISLEKGSVKQDIKKIIALRNKVTTKAVNLEDN